MKLYVNAAGDSCLQHWSIAELRSGLMAADEDQDDVLYNLICAEFKRRGLYERYIHDPNEPANIPRSEI